MTLRRSTLACAASAVFLTLGLAAASAAHAENHALIMWIGQYDASRPINKSPNLPGIDLDARNARKIAESLGVPPHNIRERSNGSLTHAGIGEEFQRLAKTINDGDNVFVYYSGHGGQINKNSGGGCTEGMVSVERNLYVDEQLSSALAAISAKAGRVIMLNDSCFSGGAATKGFSAGNGDVVPKFLAGDAIDKASAGYTCGQAVNKGTVGIFGAAASRGNNMLYVAASADDEVAGASNRGSFATLAWSACLQDRSADTNRSGGIDGDELRACSQRVLAGYQGANQTITLTGNQRLPLAFVTSVSAPATSASSGSASSAQSAQRVNVRQALEDVRASASPKMEVALSSDAQRLKINQDFLNFSVTTKESGYLYLLHVGSDGKTYNLLLPNKIDQDNFLPAGTHQFPRPKWQMQAGGPSGTSYVMAVLSKKPRNFGNFMEYKGPIADAAVDAAMPRNIIVSSATEDSGRYGASSVLSLQEY